VVGVAVLIDRSGGKVDFDCPYKPLARLNMESWVPDDLPDDLRNTPPIDPDGIVL